MPGDPLTHTVYYAGHSFQVEARQPTRIFNAVQDVATKGETAFLAIPVGGITNGHTVVRLFAIGPGMPVLIEGPAL